MSVKTKNRYSDCTLRVLALALIVFLALYRSGVSQTEHPLPVNPPTSPDVITPATDRKPAPEFVMSDSNGNTFDLSKTRGKVVIVNFWATWCGGCKYEMPWFVEFHKKYRAQGLDVIGVSMDDSMEKAKIYLVAQQISYPTVLGNDALGDKFHLGPMPLTILIDRTGKVAVMHSGVIDKNNFEMHIQQLLRS